jgi:hypothetical protein
MEETFLQTYSGDDYALTLKFTDDTGAVDISNFVIYWTIKSDPNMADADAEIAKQFVNDTTWDDGVATIYLDNDETEPLKGVYQYDIKYKSDGKVKTILNGRITFTTDITERASA